MRLFRAVSDAENDQVTRTGQLEIIPGALEGSWLAETLADARAWGQALATLWGKPHAKILVMSVADDVARGLFRLAQLDNIGPARFAEADDLPAFDVDEVTS